MAAPILLAAVLVVCSPGSMLAADKVRYGVRVGLNASWISGKEPGSIYVPSGSRARFTGGLFVTIPVSRTVSIQPEVLYSEKGAEEELTRYWYDPVMSCRITYNLNYVDVSVLLRKTVLSDGVVSLSLYAGPQVSFKVEGSEEWASGSFFGPSSVIDADWARNVVLGAAAGTSIEWLIRERRFVFDLRCSPGLQRISDTDNPSSRVYDLKNNTITFTVGMAL